MIGVITGMFALWLAPSSNTWVQVAIGALSGLAGVAAWHYILHPVVRYVWFVPIEEHAAQARQIYELQKEIRDLGSRLDQAEAKIFVTRDRQRVLDRLVAEINHGRAYLQFAERGEPIALILGHVNKWQQSTSLFVSDQIGVEAFRRFESASIPKLPPRIMPYRPDDHEALARRIRAHLDVLEALQRTLQSI